MMYPPPNNPYAPPQYGAPQYDPRLARAAQIAESARTWLIVCAVGWFFGFMWITGPLAWYQSSEFGKELQSLGVPPTSDVTNLRLLGMITTILVGVGVIIGVLALLMMFVGFAVLGSRGH